jgi:hypothetical protein
MPLNFIQEKVKTGMCVAESQVKNLYSCEVNAYSHCVLLQYVYSELLQMTQSRASGLFSYFVGSLCYSAIVMMI